MGCMSWIQTMTGVSKADIMADLCFQPARTIVPGVSCQLSVRSYYYKQEQIIFYLQKIKFPPGTNY